MGRPKIGIIMGSISDRATMSAAEDVVRAFEVPHEVFVVSAHRTPRRMFEYAETARSRGLHVIIAGAGGAAHLPGMVASLTDLPVLGVPVKSSALSGLDSLLSIVQMPAGVPVATFAIGPGGASNAALFAVRLLALEDSGLAERVAADRTRREQEALASNDALKEPREDAC